MTKTESADSAILAEQVRQWTQERDRLQDLIDVASGTESRLAATTQASTAQAEIPAILFDGHTVYQEVLAGSPNPPRTSPDNVAEVLDAVVRLIRSAGDTGSGE